MYGRAIACFTPQLMPFAVVAFRGSHYHLRSHQLHLLHTRAASIRLSLHARLTADARRVVRRQPMKFRCLVRCRAIRPRQASQACIFLHEQKCWVYALQLIVEDSTACIAVNVFADDGVRIYPSSACRTLLCVCACVPPPPAAPRFSAACSVPCNSPHGIAHPFLSFASPRLTGLSGGHSIRPRSFTG
jgi:hypothetical protein